MADYVIRRVVISTVFLVVILTGHATASSEDNFDGAVWKFQMTNKLNPSSVFVGRFRVSNHILYQKASPSDPKYSKRVGENHPNHKKTRFEVNDFRVFTQIGKKMSTIKGTGRLSYKELGEWSGLFTDGDGNNWKFKAERIQE
ncbi:hypothetical protein [Rosistilla oblonga]|uniref:hypothetical protein n=1 Tax=Rosistilla oblonga TaxID=2527990 RepID=UPI003A9867FF